MSRKKMRNGRKRKKLMRLPCDNLNERFVNQYRDIFNGFFVPFIPLRLFARCYCMLRDKSELFQLYCIYFRSYAFIFRLKLRKNPPFQLNRFCTTLFFYLTYRNYKKINSVSSLNFHLLTNK